MLSLYFPHYLVTLRDDLATFGFDFTQDVVS